MLTAPRAACSPTASEASVSGKLVSRLWSEKNKNSNKKSPEKEPRTCTHFCIQMTFSGTAELIRKARHTVNREPAPLCRKTGLC